MVYIIMPRVAGYPSFHYGMILRLDQNYKTVLPKLTNYIMETNDPGKITILIHVDLSAAAFYRYTTLTTLLRQLHQTSSWFIWIVCVISWVRSYLTNRNSFV